MHVWWEDVFWSIEYYWWRSSWSKKALRYFPEVITRGQGNGAGVQQSQTNRHPNLFIQSASSYLFPSEWIGKHKLLFASKPSLWEMQSFQFKKKKNITWSILEHDTGEGVNREKAAQGGDVMRHAAFNHFKVEVIQQNSWRNGPFNTNPSAKRNTTEKTCHSSTLSMNSYCKNMAGVNKDTIVIIEYNCQLCYSSFDIP